MLTEEQIKAWLNGPVPSEALTKIKNILDRQEQLGKELTEVLSEYNIKPRRYEPQGNNALRSPTLGKRLVDPRR